MKRKKLIILVLTIVSLTIATGCGCTQERRQIAGTMREYVECNLNEAETFCFVVLSNYRDTVFIEPRPYTGIREEFGN